MPSRRSSHARNLNEGEDNDGGDSSWSPDGKLLAFGTWRSGSAEVFLMDHDGENIRQLTSRGANNQGCVYPTWSPDGKRSRQLTRLGGLNAFAAWTPDGKQIAFTHVEGDRAPVYIMNADGSDLHAVELLRNEVALPGGIARPAWRPNHRGDGRCAQRRTRGAQCR